MVVLDVNLHQQHKNVEGKVQTTRLNFLYQYINKNFILFSLSRSPTPPSPRSPVSRSRSRSPIEGSKSPSPRKETNQRSPSPPRQSSSSSKRRRHKDSDSGRRICAICSCDVEGTKRLYGLLDNCDHVLYVNSNYFIKEFTTIFLFILF